jgi:hypothetical protein
MTLRRHAITKDTPKNIPLGAGIVVKGLEFSDSDWTYKELGASNGGNKYSYEREYIDLAVDGKTVKVEGFDVKVAETFKITFNLASYERETIVTALSLKEDNTGDVTGYKKYKPSNENVYIENLGFVGYTAEGKAVIIKVPKAICLSAFEVETKNKEQGSAFVLEFDAVAPADAASYEELGIEFYFPIETV